MFGSTLASIGWPAAAIDAPGINVTLLLRPCLPDQLTEASCLPFALAMKRKVSLSPGVSLRASMWPFNLGRSRYASAVATPPRRSAENSESPRFIVTTVTLASSTLEAPEYELVMSGAADATSVPLATVGLSIGTKALACFCPATAKPGAPVMIAAAREATAVAKRIFGKADRRRWRIRSNAVAPNSDCFNGQAASRMPSPPTHVSLLVQNRPLRQPKKSCCGLINTLWHRCILRLQGP